MPRLTSRSRTRPSRRGGRDGLLVMASESLVNVPQVLERRRRDEPAGVLSRGPQSLARHLKVHGLDELAYNLDSRRPDPAVSGQVADECLGDARRELTPRADRWLAHRHDRRSSPQGLETVAAHASDIDPLQLALQLGEEVLSEGEQDPSHGAGAQRRLQLGEASGGPPAPPGRA